MDTFETIERIELKLKQVVLKMQQLQLENARLQKDKEELESKLLAQQNRVEQSEEQFVQTKRDLESRLEREVEHSTKLKSAIDHYTKEIDRCIEWLTNN